MITINGYDWIVKLVSPNHPGLYKSNGELSLGACDRDTGTIYINDSLDSRLFKKVLCHEITHAAMFSYGVILSYDQEEIIADLIATYGEEIVCVTQQIFDRLCR